MAKKGEGNGWLRRKKGHTYYCCFTAEGKERTKVLGPDSMSDKAAWKKVSDDDLYKLARKSAPTELLFSEVADAFLKWGKNFKASHYGEELADTTKALHRHMVDDYLIPRFGDVPATEITTAAIQQWLDGLEGKHTRTKYKIKTLFGTIYNWAHSPSGITDFPEYNPVCRKVKCSDKSDWEAKTFKADQTLAVLSYLPICERTLLLLVATTGLRQSETLALKWADLDVANNEIHVTKAYVGHLKKTKTDSSRSTIPYHLLLQEAMKAWKAESMYTADTDFVFASVKCEGRVPRSGSILVKDYLRPAAVKAKVIDGTEKRFGFHNFRHSFGTALAKAGNDPKLIQTMLRHATEKMTLHYLHATHDERLEAQGRLLEGFLPAITGATTGAGGTQQP